ncbi:hypothetical protein EDB89DRAFT_1909535 [Lactarius sanguifluus]|nr:hypothetical protein EDB89DRAFT_1909535 [Lactarius sanguifluus]
MGSDGNWEHGGGCGWDGEYGDGHRWDGDGEYQDGEMGIGNMGVGVGGMGNIGMGVGEMGMGNMGVGVGGMGVGNMEMGTGGMGMGNIRMGVGEMGMGNMEIENASAGVTKGPRGRDQRDYWRDAQDDTKWACEVHGATAVLERLLESGGRPTDHVKVGQLSLDELAPRLRLEFIADASYLIIITLALALALVGHTLRIALAVAYRILKTVEVMQQQQTGN